MDWTSHCAVIRIESYTDSWHSCSTRQRRPPALCYSEFYKSKEDSIQLVCIQFPDWGDCLPAIDERIDDAILIPLGQGRVADRAAEAVHVKDKVPGAHHQLVGANRSQAAGTAASCKKTVIEAKEKG